jgi:hypothetical protein
LGIVPVSLVTDLRPPEAIDRAAVRYAGTVYAPPRPGRHDRALFMLWEAEEAKGNRPHDSEQGFVTSTGRFVDRKEAARIALTSGQIKELSRPGLGILFSEDLW